MKGAVEVAIDAARAAGRIQRERSRDIGQIDYKESRADPVTEVDLLCEREIIRRIKEKFPDHDILAEESGTREGGASPSRWLIDPLDGTLNYAHGYPCYCASVALEHEGEVIVGVVYNPCLDELFVAEKGKGATLNSETLSVSTVSSLQNSFLVTGFAPTLREALNLNLIHFSNFM
nr:inositol monophosphatase [Nitrospinaceae bacterium]NIR53853.1 inositol monophosphatase [Nitrospinaceae bacterium]NIS84263.1 inositol monophosphatase [Nitrospinaceae bacterium]NIT81070.1 inositol monophosphatase [Nitrospinaceae bacterium]NIU43356.1 inositol monophosphatase [Nitrospinaceae bacterium]